MRREDLPKPNATCEICGRPYYVCYKCIELKGLGMDVWKLHTDTQDCYRVYMVINEYKRGFRSCADARDGLEWALRYAEEAPSFTQDVQAVIDEIMTGISAGDKSEQPKSWIDKLLRR